MAFYNWGEQVSNSFMNMLAMNQQKKLEDGRTKMEQQRLGMAEKELKDTMDTNALQRQQSEQAMAWQKQQMNDYNRVQGYKQTLGDYDMTLDNTYNPTKMSNEQYEALGGYNASEVRGNYNAWDADNNKYVPTEFYAPGSSFLGILAQNNATAEQNASLWSANEAQRLRELEVNNSKKYQDSSLGLQARQYKDAKDALDLQNRNDAYSKVESGAQTDPFILANTYLGSNGQLYITSLKPMAGESQTAFDKRNNAHLASVRTKLNEQAAMIGQSRSLLDSAIVSGFGKKIAASTQKKNTSMQLESDSITKKNWKQKLDSNTIALLMNNARSVVGGPNNKYAKEIKKLKNFKALQSAGIVDADGNFKKNILQSVWGM